MKSTRIGCAIAILLIVFGLMLMYGGQAKADSVKVSKTFTGFAFEKADLNLGIKKQIRDWLDANPGYTVASCVGYTGNNVKNRSQTFLKKLALNRSKNICDYIRERTGTITINSTQGVPGTGGTAAARRVTVTLYKNSGGGGSGVVVVGVCDNSLKVTMRSRFTQNAFFFSHMTIRDIASSCKGNIMDVYFIDASGEQMAVSTDNEITKDFLRLPAASFEPSSILSGNIVKVAFEIRAKE